MVHAFYRLALEAKSRLYEQMAKTGDNAEDEDGRLWYYYIKCQVQYICSWCVNKQCLYCNEYTYIYMTIVVTL